jgi:hypothetical protein
MRPATARTAKPCAMADLDHAEAAGYQDDCGDENRDPRAYGDANGRAVLFVGAEGADEDGIDGANDEQKAADTEGLQAGDLQVAFDVGDVSDGVGGKKPEGCGEE